MSRGEESAAKRVLWGERIREWEASGLGQARYCREKGLPFHQFVYWRKRCRPAEPVAFAEVSVPVGVGVFGCRGGLVVRVRERYAVEVCEGFSPELLCRVVRVLEGL